jgi:hypothetical protein
MDQTPPSREFVAARVRECWDTLRRVPAHGVPGHKSQWPEIVRDAEEAYGYTAAVVRLPPASPRAIDRMHETFGWFRYLEGQRHLTLAMWFTVGRGMSTHRAGAILGAHRNTIANRRNDALDQIVDGLRRDLAGVQFVRHCAVFPIRSASLRTR